MKLLKEIIPRYQNIRNAFAMHRCVYQKKSFSLLRFIGHICWCVDYSVGVKVVYHAHCISVFNIKSACQPSNEEKLKSTLGEVLSQPVITSFILCHKILQFITKCQCQAKTHIWHLPLGWWHIIKGFHLFSFIYICIYSNLYKISLKRWNI